MTFKNSNAIIGGDRATGIPWLCRKQQLAKQNELPLAINRNTHARAVEQLSS